jgi:ParB-like chromosome segregation protein Spo0J
MTKIEYFSLNDIEVADANPKDHDIGEIYSSIKRWGFVEPIIKNETTGKLVAGHGRLETLKLLEKEDKSNPPTNINLDDDGNWLIPVVTGVSFKSDAEADAYLIASNRLVEKGGWKTDELMDLLDKVATDTEDLSGVGFDLDDMQNLLDDMEYNIFEEEDIDEPDDETTIRFKLGRYRFGIDADHFYKWEEKIVKDLGSNSPQDIIEWIKDQLDLRG